MFKAIARKRRMTSQGQNGFTLVEVLVAIVITGVLASGIGAMLLGSLKQEQGTRSRLDTSVAEQQLGYWLPADVASMGREDSDFSNTPADDSGCADPGTGGTNVLRLQWVESADGKQYNASYRIETVDGVDALVRRFCEVGQTGSYQVMIPNLKTQKPGDPYSALASKDANNVVTLNVTVESNGLTATFESSAKPRTPKENPLPVAVPTPPGGVGPTPCTIASFDLTSNGINVVTDLGSSVPLQGGPLQQGLQAAIGLRVTTTGQCGDLSVRVLGPNNESPATRSFALSQSPKNTFNGSVSTAQLWQSGSHTFSILDTGAPVGTPVNVTFTHAPCRISTVTLQPQAIVQQLVPNTDPSQLKSPVTVAIGTTGSCAASQIAGAITAGWAGPPAVANTRVPPITTFTVIAAGTNIWSYTIPAATPGQNWWRGAYTIRATGPTNNVATRLDVARYQNCASELAEDTPIRISPNPVPQVAGNQSQTSRKLLQNLVITAPVENENDGDDDGGGPLTPSVICSGLVLKITSTNPLAPILEWPMTPIDRGNFSDWVVTIPANAQSWPAGVYTWRLWDGVVDLGPSFTRTFTVQQGCTVTNNGLTLNPNPQKQVGGGADPAALRSNVAVSADRVNGSFPCTNLEAVFSGPPTPGVASVALSAADPAVGSIPGNNQPWLIGQYGVTLTENGAAIAGWPTAQFVVAEGCKIDSVTAVPSSVSQVSGSGNARTLKTQVTLTIVESPGAVCGTVSARITGPTPRDITLTETAPGSGTWRATTSVALTWNAGLYTVAALDDGITAGGPTASFTVNGGCTITNPQVTPSVAQVAGSGSTARPIATPITIQFDRSGTCGDLRATIARVSPTPNPPVTLVDLPDTGATISTQVPGVNGENWSTGSYLVTVTEDNLNVAGWPTDTFTVTQGCSVLSNGLAVTASAKLASSTSPNQLAQPVTITANYTGTCSITAVITGASNGLQVGRTPITLAGNPATGTIAANQPSELWSTGQYNVTLYNFNNPVNGWPTSQFTVTPGCSVTSATATDSSLVTGAGSARRLASNIVIDVTTTGTCVTMQARFNGSPTTPPNPPVSGTNGVTLNANGANAWRATITPANGQNWSAGSYTANIFESGLNSPSWPDAPFAITSGCTLVSLQASPTVNTASAFPSPAPLGSVENITVTLGANATCGTLRAVVTPNNPLSGGIVTLSGTGATRTGSIPTTSGNWAFGTYRVELQENGTNTGVFDTFDVEGPPCVVSSVSASPSSISRVTGQSGTERALSGTVTFNATATGDCTNELTVQVREGTSTNGQTQYNPSTTLTNTGTNTWSITMPGSPTANAPTFDAGVQTARIFRNNTSQASTQFTVTEGCSITGFTASPSTNALSGSPAPKPLSADEVITANFAAGSSCGTLRATISPNGPGGLANITLATPVTNGRSGTISAATSGNWNTGTYNVALQESPLSNGTFGNVNGFTDTFVVQAPPCTVTGGASASPSTIGRAPGQSNTERSLSGPVTFSVTATGDCSGLLTAQVRAGTSNNGTVQYTSGALTQVGVSTTWTVTMPVAAGTTFGTGTQTVRFIQGGNTQTSTTFTVSESCSVSVSASPNSINQSGVNDPGPATGNVTLTLTLATGASCTGPLTASLTPNTPVASVTFAGAGTTRTATVTTSSGNWASGTFDVQVFDNGVTATGATTSFDVNQAPCVVASNAIVTASPNPVGRINTNRLANAVTLTVSAAAASGNCTGQLTVQVRTQGGGGTTVWPVNTSATLTWNGTAWTTSIPANSNTATFNAGTYNIRLRQNGNTVGNTTTPGTLTVQ